MALSFENQIEIPRIPSTPAKTARQALNVLKRSQEIGDLQQAKNKALEAILNVSTTEGPSEIRRLRLLYKEVYTKEELKSFIDRTFDFYGIHQI